MRKKLISLLVIGMLMLVAAGTSLAYMNDKTNVLINTFAAAPLLDAELREPAWDGIEFGETNALHPESPDLGIQKAKAYTPNMILPKDPAIRNNNESDGMSEWVGIRISYVDDNGVNARDYIKNDAVPYDEKNWLKLPSEEKDVEYYIYRHRLAPQVTTSSLFEYVQIKAVLEEEQTRAFHIEAAGFALQGTMEFEEAKEELLKMMK